MSKNSRQEGTMYELLIQNGSTVYFPPVKETVKVTTERQITPVERYTIFGGSFNVFAKNQIRIQS